MRVAGTLCMVVWMGCLLNQQTLGCRGNQRHAYIGCLRDEWTGASNQRHINGGGAHVPSCGDFSRAEHSSACSSGPSSVLRLSTEIWCHNAAMLLCYNAVHVLAASEWLPVVGMECYTCALCDFAHR